jgi:hypothetical protein
MLILLPVSILLLAGLALLIVRWLRPAFSYAWLLAILASLAAWAAMLALRFFLPQQLPLLAWRPVTLFGQSPALLLDPVSWPFSFALVSLVLAVIQTATARVQSQMDMGSWAGIMLLGGVGVLAVLAGNPLTLILAWAGLDLVELVFLIVNAEDANHVQMAILAYAAQTGGILFACLAIGVGSQPGGGLQFGRISPEVGFYLLLAAAMRVGVLPLHLPFSQEAHMRRGVGTLLRLGPVASCLMLLARLPGSIVPAAWMSTLLALTALAGVYSAVMWLVSANELEGRPYWVVAVAALAVTCSIRGTTQGSLVWGTAMLLSGGLLFLYSARSPRMTILWILGLVGLSGLPFTPTASGWAGVLSGPGAGFNFLLLMAYFLLMLGYIRHALAPGDDLSKMEPWVRGIYPAGLAVTVLAMGLVEASSWRTMLTIGNPLVGGVLPAVAALIGLFGWRFPPAWLQNLYSTPLLAWLRPAIQRSLDALSEFFKLNWLYKFIAGIFRLVGALARGLTRVFEGDGGVLWALLLLVLLVTLVQSGGRP